jgi:hypothetical protein
MSTACVRGGYRKRSVNSCDLNIVLLEKFDQSIEWRSTSGQRLHRYEFNKSPLLTINCGDPYSRFGNRDAPRSRAARKIDADKL